MSKLRVHTFTISLDGYAAGRDQAPDAPFGHAGMRLHQWMFTTRTGRGYIGEDGGTEGVDDGFVAAGDVGIGATIMGRNMFGPVRGAWPDLDWTGWWGPNPPYHHDVFVLTHHPRPDVAMDGGTTFRFVDDEPAAVLARAVEAAGGQDVRLAGGAATIQQFLRAGLVDEMHVAIVPVLLGGGERLFDAGAGDLVGYDVAPLEGSGAVTHARITRRS